jgi:hypothetical protein
MMIFELSVMVMVIFEMLVMLYWMWGAIYGSEKDKEKQNGYFAVSYYTYAVSFGLCSRQSFETWQLGIAPIPWAKGAAHDKQKPCAVSKRPTHDNQKLCAVSLMSGSRQPHDVSSSEKVPRVDSVPWAEKQLNRSSVPWAGLSAHGSTILSPHLGSYHVWHLCPELAVRLTTQLIVKAPPVSLVKCLWRKLLTAHDTRL